MGDNGGGTPPQGISPLKALLTIAAFVGIVLSQIGRAFLTGLRSGKKREEYVTLTAGLMNQQAALLQFLINQNIRMMNEFVFESDDEKRIRRQSTFSMHEVNCRTDHVEIVERNLDDAAKNVIREVASFAHGLVSSFDLKLGNVTLEPDAPSDDDRENDIVLVFHVLGNGNDALRFQAEISRKMREASVDIWSARCLRTDVRWT